MSKPIIGIVGGIGCGKSAVSQACHRRGAVLVEGDRIAHASHQQPEIRDQIFARFPTVRGADDKVDRRKLGGIVFANPAELRALEAIVFPWIHAEIRREIAEAQQNPDIGWIVLDAAIMFETGWATECDRILYVHAPRAIRQQRVLTRGWSAAELVRRESLQWPLARKAAAAHGAIDNSGSLESLERQIDHWVQRWELIQRSNRSASTTSDADFRP
ncbi:dephospho-CoA kinase [Tuwongella immobilis]|uniref:Dephospho-CoA kinase n=1 Tax=Tuwongella immobilis TaxID=692036 RepID=A0A6C2YNL8_9BACT|nr:dephospho-CoA kinase [Tuwongella immobilis]VIP03220.1 dephospho- kinase : Dephospho-CoA kinase OS=Planctomyces brasiliensis (strain ATCC 49424 / DSM 5305 / JCM 21570 / NBRC 103401 / IFAM 1448) GN=coaE PE=3 SV=1: CoaE [Tuwongella immobilis]VTS03747.1 dephospho- kinase : Dephospho-CoA kinase OS=Planctomyces brasiliensis (strain ATCC 49424 / DSM 5305 / JCM 21570 / NBRC 103401 / IFAM 1448) GN=coaE PE=3 SV=1: CoaE [Tuwongella immobilis]